MTTLPANISNSENMCMDYWLQSLPVIEDYGKSWTIPEETNNSCTFFPPCTTNCVGGGGNGNGSCNGTCVDVCADAKLRCEPIRNDTGPFANCQAMGETAINILYQQCVFDYCTNNDNDNYCRVSPTLFTL